TLEEKARSYLAVNCSNCPHAGGTASGSWDGRAHLTLQQTGLINGAATNNGGDPANLLVVPGETDHSIVLNRVAESNGLSRIPPIGSSDLDESAIERRTDWILGLGVSPPGNRSASAGTSFTQVEISWDAVPDASAYEIWRATVDNTGSAILID